jgi:hypothetical protein
MSRYYPGRNGPSVAIHSDVRLSVRSHQILDYFLVALLALSPWIFGFERVVSARNVFWVLAVISLLSSILTDAGFSLARWLPLGVHRVFDVTVGYWLMISPQLFGYGNRLSGFAYFLHFAIGVAWIASGILVKVPTLPTMINESDKGAPIEHPTRPKLMPWVAAALAVNVSFSLWVMLGPKGRPPRGGIVPENQVAQGLDPNALQGFVTRNEMNVDPGKASEILEVTGDPTFPAFHPNRLEAKAGSVVCVQFTNPSKVNAFDNFVLVQPGTEQHVGREAMKVGPEAGYIPILPNEIIANTATVPPGESASTCFRVPEKPGQYPFISSARNRWTAMRGIFVVKSANPSGKNTG